MGEVVVFVFELDVDGDEIEGLCAVDLFEPFDEDEGVGVFDGVPIPGGFEFFEGGEAIEVEVVDGASVCFVLIDDGEGW